MQQQIMNESWEVKQIGDIAHHDITSLESVSSDSNYPMVGVYSFGKGLFIKEPVSGLNTSYKNFYRLKAKHIVMSQLFGWEGAIAVSSEDFEGRYVSSQFPTFLVDEGLADTKFVGYYLKQEHIWKLLFSKGRGMGSRRRTLTPDNLLSLEIRLPSLRIQKQIVEKLESVRLSLEKIRLLKGEQTKDIKNLLYSKYSEIIEGADWLPMNEVAPIHRRSVKIELSETYQELGTRSFFKGVFEKESFRGSDLSWEKPHWMKAGDLVFSNIKAWEGSVALISEKHDGWVASHRYITCLPKHELIKPEFLLYFFSTPHGMDILSNASPGSADRNRTLNTKKLMQAKVPIPALELQKEFVDLVHKIEALREHHKQTEKELGELMPSLLDKAFKGELK